MNLMLGGVVLVPEELRALGYVIASTTNITTIDMTDCNLADSGVEVVADALSGYTSVTALGLSGNTISDVGAQHVARMLSKNSSIVSLFLRNNSIGEEGAREIAGSLQGNTRLARLNLKNNSLSEGGAKELACMLRYNNNVFWSLLLLHRSISRSLLTLINTSGITRRLPSSMFGTTSLDRMGPWLWWRR